MGPQPNDSREPQRVAALMPIRLLNIVECNFDHYYGLDSAAPPEVLPSVGLKEIIELGKFCVG